MRWIALKTHGVRTSTVHSSIPSHKDRRPLLTHGCTAKVIAGREVYRHVEGREPTWISPDIALVRACFLDCRFTLITTFQPEAQECQDSSGQTCARGGTIFREVRSVSRAVVRATEDVPSQTWSGQVLFFFFCESGVHDTSMNAAMSV